MAKSKAAKRTKSQNAIIRYLRDTRAELRKVRWPTRQEAWGLTRIVLAVTVALALFMWLLDYLFSLMLSGLVNQNIVAIIVASVVLAGSIATFVILNLQRAQ